MLGRIWPQTLDPYGLFLFSFTGSPDMTGGDDSLWKAAAAFQLGLTQPGTTETSFQLAGEIGDFSANGQQWQAGMPVMLYRPDLAEAASVVLSISV